MAGMHVSGWRFALGIGISSWAALGCASDASCPSGDCAPTAQSRAALAGESLVTYETSTEEPAPFGTPPPMLRYSPVDNPSYGPPYTYGSTTGTGVSISVTPGFTTSHFRLLFDENVTPGKDGPGSKGRGNDLVPWPSLGFTPFVNDPPPPPGEPEQDYVLPFEAHGARLGFGKTTLYTHQVITLPNSTIQDNPLTDITDYTLFPNTELVPVTAIIVVPNYPYSVVKAEMEDLADQEYQLLLWDDIWAFNLTAGGGGVTGTARQVPTKMTIDEAKLQLAGPHVQPDKVWSQCGIQFRLNDVIVYQAPKEVDKPGFAGYKWNQVDFMRRRGCTTDADCQPGGLAPNLGPCVSGSCEKAEGVCDDFERESVGDSIIETARAIPHNDVFGVPVPTDSASRPKTLPIIFNWAAKNDTFRFGCNTASTENSQGFTPGSTWSLIAMNGFDGSARFTLAHEIGHYLGLGHPDDIDKTKYCGGSMMPPGDKTNLMCSTTTNMGPHIHGCQQWEESGTWPPNTLWNCNADWGEHPVFNATCAAARTKAHSMMLTFLQDEQCKLGLGTGPVFDDTPLPPVSLDTCGPADLEQPTATDACDDELDIDNDAPESFGVGSTTVTWTATNDKAQVGTAEQEVVVTDTTPPVFEGPLPLAPVSLTNCGPATLPEPEVSDACEGAVTLDNDAPASFGSGTTHVTWTATDAAGNPATATQDVIVTDAVGPTFTLVPGDVTTTRCSSPPLGTAAASDACGGVVTISNNAPVKFPIGTTIVTWTARDAHNNPTTATQRVTVVLGDDSSCCPSGSHVVVGTPSNDTLNGTSGSDCILGRGGQDTINGLGGNDYLAGGDGDDIVSGGDGNDVIAGGSGQDTLNGNNGNDILSGDDGNDILHGNANNDTLSGGQGQDQLFGDDGDDTLFGDAGSDTLSGGNGNDLLSGGAATDTCSGDAGTNVFEQCEGGATNACTNGALSGSETSVDCGGGCPACEEGLACSIGGDCQSNVCAGNVCQDLPGGIAVKLTVDSDWGAGYCVHLDVTNVKTQPTTGWTAQINTNQSTVSSSGSSTVSPSSGVVTLTPNAAKSVIAAGQTNSGTSFCANRASSSSGLLPFVTAASASY